MSKNAIVIGGSIAGLFTAKALTRHFEHITIIERDEYPDEPTFRDGTPQARHAHIMLYAAQHAVNTYFPDLTAQMEAEGVDKIVWGRDSALYMPGAGWMPRPETDCVTFTCSRPRLEWMMRRSLLDHPQITFRTQVLCTGLVMDGDTVTGVNLHDKVTRQADVLHADLVVDASGRSSKTPEWLEALGYPTPKETVVNAYLGYATRWYREPEGFKADWKAIAAFANPRTGDNRSGLILRLENGLWSVVVYGANQDYPPTEEAGFMAFAKSLNVPEIYEAIQHAEPVTPIYGYRRTENRLRHYHQLKRRPENFIILGDAVCSFNPVYGQGMSVAGKEVMALDNLLSKRGIGKGFAAAFQKRLSATIQDAWLMATGSDLAYPGTDGTRPNAIMRKMQQYLDFIQMSLIGHDADFAYTFLRVLNMKARPFALMHPRFLFKALRANRAKPAPSVFVEKVTSS